MKAVFGSVSENSDRSLSDLTRFRPVFSDFLPSGLFGGFILSLLAEDACEPPEVPQCKQRMQSRSVLGQTTVPNLRDVVVSRKLTI